MADVVFLAVVVGFFALCVLFVKACAALAGPDQADVATTDAAASDSSEPSERVAA